MFGQDSDSVKQKQEQNKKSKKKRKKNSTWLKARKKGFINLHTMGLFYMFFLLLNHTVSVLNILVVGLLFFYWLPTSEDDSLSYFPM